MQFILCQLGLFLMLISTTTASTSFPTTITAIQNDHEGVGQEYGTFNFNTTTILRVLRQLNYLTLYLNDVSELRSNIIRFLLKQETCPLQVFILAATKHPLSADSGQYTHKFFVPPINSAVFVKAGEILSTLTRFAFKEGSLLCLIYGESNDAELIQVAEQIWKSRSIHRIYYITYNQCRFYNPFAISTDGSTFGALADANHFRMEKIFSNMNGYAIRTYIFDSVYSSVYGNPTTKTITTILGADSEAALLLSKKLNFTMTLQWPDDEFFGARLENGSYNGALGRLIRAETDVTLTGFFVKDYLTRDIIFTVSIYMDELCCYVMKARRVPQSILPLFAVRVDIWIGFFSVGFFSPFIWMLMRHFNLIINSAPIPRKRKHLYFYNQYARIFIDTWVAWVRVNITRFPSFYSERVFVASLCLVSVIYGALFESSLATVYIRPLYYKDINTLSELDDAGFRIYIKHAAMKDDLFYGHSSKVYENLDRKLLLVAETEERLISMMSRRGGFAAVTRASSLVLDDIRYFITNKIHKIPECPKNYHIAFVLPRHSPFEEPFNVHLLHFLQAGLLDQWIDVMKHKAKTRIYTYPDYKAEKDNQWKVLTLKDLQLAFYALGFGCTVALLSLFGERLLWLKLSLCCAT